jgi:hypothetical protein
MILYWFMYVLWSVLCASTIFMFFHSTEWKAPGRRIWYEKDIQLMQIIWYELNQLNPELIPSLRFTGESALIWEHYRQNPLPHNHGMMYDWTSTVYAVVPDTFQAYLRQSLTNHPYLSIQTHDEGHDTIYLTHGTVHWKYPWSKTAPFPFVEFYYGKETNHVWTWYESTSLQSQRHQCTSEVWEDVIMYPWKTDLPSFPACKNITPFLGNFPYPEKGEWYNARKGTYHIPLLLETYYKSW